VKILLGAAFALVTFPALAATPVTGKWITAEKDSIIEIGACGDKVCGRVLRVMKMMSNGKMPLDANNPNPDGTLKVQGCIGFLCKAYTWTAVR